MKTVIVLGSSRSDGHSAQIATLLSKKLGADIVDLLPLDIHPYEYNHAHGADDFIPTFKALLEYDLMVFVTPVYWYSMSGIMKNFFDRITDCLKVEKDTGRSRGFGFVSYDTPAAAAAAIQELNGFAVRRNECGFVRCNQHSPFLFPPLDWQQTSQSTAQTNTSSRCTGHDRSSD